MGPGSSRVWALALCASLGAPSAAPAQTGPYVGRAMVAIASGDVCPSSRCRVLQTLRVGRTRVQVIASGDRITTTSLVVRHGRRVHTEVLGQSGGEAFGGAPLWYDFDRVEPIEADGDARTTEIVVLAGGPRDPTASYCQLGPTPCCVALTAEVVGNRTMPATFDAQGTFPSPSGPARLRFCPGS